MKNLITKYLKNFKNPKILISAGAIGLILILISSFFGNTGEKSKPNTETKEITVEEYKASLEEDIRETVKGITGSKNISVIITLESGMRYSYADTKEETVTEKQDSNNKSSDNGIKKGYITIKTSDGGEEALLITAEMPEVRGVAIVCDGGDNEYIREKIQSAVTAALNITSKRVYICGRNTR